MEEKLQQNEARVSFRFHVCLPLMLHVGFIGSVVLHRHPPERLRICGPVNDCGGARALASKRALGNGGRSRGGASSQVLLLQSKYCLGSAADVCLQPLKNEDSYVVKEFHRSGCEQN